MKAAHDAAGHAPSPPLRLGLRENLGQFSLLVVVNAFVGAMVGVERAVLPVLGEREFGLASSLAILSFIASFGVVKALANLASGRLADRLGRKPLLVAGWLLGIPVPILILYAPSWEWVVAANVLLGLNQGLAWSMTVISKIDLVGPKQRGLAMGLNEFAGYLSVGVVAYAAWSIAETHGLRPWPFLLAEGIAVLGLALSIFLVKETHGHARHEAAHHAPAAGAHVGRVALLGAPGRNFFSSAQAGLVNNLNDAVAWGIIPLFLLTRPGGAAEVGLVAALYPASWGILQLATGALSDRWGRKWLIAGGMAVQAAAIWLIVLGDARSAWIAGSVLLGLGTAMVYPTLLAAVSDGVTPTSRGAALGAYRFWRDGGYVAGALLGGALADAAGLSATLHGAAALTLASGILVAIIMREARAPPRALTA